MTIEEKMQAIRAYKDRYPDASIYEIRQQYQCSPLTVKKALFPDDKVLPGNSEQINQKRSPLPRADVRQFRSDHPEMSIADIAAYFGLNAKQIERCLYVSTKDYQEYQIQEIEKNNLKSFVTNGTGVLLCLFLFLICFASIAKNSESYAI
jgi:hypothetical protein